MTDVCTLFLDFDGVLHPVDAATFDNAGRLMADPRLFTWLPVLADIVAPHPEVRIVVSSDWRRLLDDDNLKRVLGSLGPRFAGVVETWGASRAAEILEEVRRRRLSHWLALDDHPSVEKASRHDARFIVCAPDSGLSAPAVQASLRARLAAMLY
ncbi:HAD domain-containing protein [Burkholderia pseudomallei]|uniref:HAD domain-containing protein n=1 Tax=Burkholderia pseudomallei TaxID=28450 RepID=UPI0005367B27|nr:HAD domain-containing protein [Burkholderia pseudomallei]KGX39452.1 hypothetical protein Y043_2832 [Burkholderia pseudomallei MSHR2138]